MTGGRRGGRGDGARRVLDLSTPSGRMVARQLGAVARYESEHKSERQRRKHQELAEASKSSGGGARP
jgi:site-specific DNA recombinase